MRKVVELHWVTISWFCWNDHEWCAWVWCNRARWSNVSIVVAQTQSLNARGGSAIWVPFCMSVRKQDHHGG